MSSHNFSPKATTPFNDYNFQLKDSFLGLQTLFIAFGALVLMPILTGLDPNVALFTAGVGTLIFQLVTRGQVPAFLGSSFAFAPATIYGVQQWGLAPTLCGLAVSSIMFFIFSALIKWRGQAFLRRFFPPIVTAPIITSIGLMLAPVAINLLMGKSGDGSVQLSPNGSAMIIGLITFMTTVVTRIFLTGRLKLVPILFGVVVGYLSALVMSKFALGPVIDFSKVAEASWFSMPNFTRPEWHWGAVLMILPIAAVSAIEHIGGIGVLSAITGRPYYEYPGAHRTLLGDGLSSGFASLVGGPPNITYAEVTAGVALTRMFNPAIMTWAAIIAILLAFVGKIGAFLQTIPLPVTGGISMLLFGTIAVAGLNLLMHSKEDLMKARSMTIVGVILVISIGNLTLNAGNLSFSGIGLASMLGVLLNLILPDPKDALA